MVVIVMTVTWIVMGLLIIFNQLRNMLLAKKLSTYFNQAALAKERPTYFAVSL